MEKNHYAYLGFHIEGAKFFISVKPVTSGRLKWESTFSYPLLLQQDVTTQIQCGAYAQCTHTRTSKRTNGNNYAKERKS